MTTIDRRAFLESAARARRRCAALRPRAGRRGGRHEEGRLRLDAPEGARLPRALPAGASTSGFEGIEIGTITDPAVADEIKEASAKTGLDDPLRDERGPLEVPALERGPGGRVEERRRHGDVAAQREALGRGQRAAGARRRQPRDLLPGRLDALAEGHQGAHPAARPGAEGRRSAWRRSGTSSCSARSRWRATWTSSPRPG